jgi:hypothetical protein
MLVYQKSEDGKSIEVNDEGLPIVYDDEKDDVKSFGIDAIHLYSKIPDLQKESKGHRLNAKEANEKLKAFEGLDPEKAAKALEITKNLSAGDLTKKEEVERLKQETENAWTEKLKAVELAHANATKTLQDEISMREVDLRKSLLSNRFATSPHFSGKEPTTTLTADIAEAYFGKYFKIEKNKAGTLETVGYIGDDMIYSKSRPGESATFNEAMDEILERYPMKDSIMQKSEGSGAQGGGRRGGQSISKGDNKGFADNLDAIAAGKIKVV